jgi:hypothetical protein
MSLYSLLLIVTPFIMLRKFLQDGLGRFSASHLRILGMSLPTVLVIAVGLSALLLFLFRPRITRRRVAAIVVGLAMFGLGQQLTDYYYGHSFYELQMNWHYIAYSFFALFSYRHLRVTRRMPLARCLLVTIGLAGVYSAFDEGFQLWINNRVFDMSDIGKDIWGSFIGMTMVLLITPHPELARGAWKRIRRPRVRDYFTHVSSAWVLLLVLTLLFLGFASLLTESPYILLIVGITFAVFIPFFAILHFSQYRVPGRILLVTGALAVLALSGSFIRHRNDGVGQSRYGMTVYKGIPLPFFDVMVFPNGWFRLVDKKHYFNTRDRTFFMRRWEPDILLIGTGYHDVGGKGFPHLKGSRFIYNRFTERGIQVILLNSRDACARFDELKAQGKNVLFILHSTC